MKRKSKWIAVPSPNAPVSDVARQALAARWETVWFYLPRAANHAEQDTEFVHQLRVSSRRAGAALVMFEDLLPKKHRRRAARHLRKIRRAAGAARDDDVLLARLEQPLATADGSRATIPAEILTQLREHREQAQETIRRVYLKSIQKNWKQADDRVVGGARWREEGREPAFPDWARERLRPSVKAVLEIAGRIECGSGGVSDNGMLHQLRIAGKRLRYTMELVASAFPPEFRSDLYSRVEQLQDRLGEVNDHASARDRFRAWIASNAPGETSAALARLLSQESQLMDESIDRFHTWRQSPKSAKLRSDLEKLLADG